MQFLNHDYYSNFEGAVKSGDVDLTLDLWVNEVSDLIMSDAGKVIDLLNKTGIKTEQNVSDEEIVESIITNIGNNNQLNRGISFLIAEMNGIIKKDKDWKTKVDNMGATYKILLDKSLTNSTVSGSIKNDIMKQIKSKADSKGDYKRIIFKQVVPEAAKKKKSKKAYYIIGGLLVLTAIGVGIYFYRKNKAKKALSLLVDGGSLVPTGGVNANTVIPPPIMNVTPTPIPTANAINNISTPTPMSTPNIGASNVNTSAMNVNTNASNLL